MKPLVPLIVLASILAGCSRNPGDNPGGPAGPLKPLPPGCWIEERSQPKLPEEQAVADYILHQSKRPKTVVFKRWGPHDLTGRWLRRIRGGEQSNPVIRLVWGDRDFDGGERTVDLLYIIHPGNKIEPIIWVGNRDRWFGAAPDDD